MSGSYLFDLFVAERTTVNGVIVHASVADVLDFMNRYVLNNTSTVEVAGSLVTALYSFDIGPDTLAVKTQFLALDLALRSANKVRVIDNTEAGKFLELLLFDDSAKPFINFVQRDQIDTLFNPLSTFFIANTHHPIITITPKANASRVFGNVEVPAIAANTGIATINGTARADIGFNLFSSADAARKAYLLAVLNGEFGIRNYGDRCVNPQTEQALSLLKEEYGISEWTALKGLFHLSS